MATAMNLVFSSWMISGSAKVDSRSRIPLFQVQPSGWPSIAQMKMGLCWLTEARWASSREIFHGMVRHGASAGACSCRCSCWNCCWERVSSSWQGSGIELRGIELRGIELRGIEAMDAMRQRIVIFIYRTLSVTE